MKAPSRVDDVLRYSSSSAFPTTGVKGKWYFDLSTGTPYIWNGSAYDDVDPTVDEIWARTGTEINYVNNGDDVKLKDGSGNQTWFHDSSAGSTESGRAGEAGVEEIKDASEDTKIKLNSIGDSFITNSLGLGTETPNTLLDVQGGQTVKKTIVNAATYDLLVTDFILHVTYTVTGAVTSITLPTAQCVSVRMIHVKDAGGNAGTNNITIDTEGAETIDGAATAVINTNYASLTLYSDGTNWFIL